MVPSAGGRRRSRLHCSLPTALLACVVALAGCSGEKSETAPDPGASTSSSGPVESRSATPPDWPSCAKVWVADAAFPGNYAGCLEDGTTVRADKTHCSSGQVIVTYADRFYAVQGEHVNETAGLSGDASYKSAMSACLA